MNQPENDEQEIPQGVVDAEVLDADAVASICKATRKTTVDKMNEGQLPGVKVGREWICTRTALLAELTRQSLANVDRKGGPAATPPAPAPAAARPALRPVPPSTDGKGSGRRRNVPPVLPPFPGDLAAPLAAP